MPETHRQLAWHHLKCVMPSEWEVTAYAIESRIGRMEFSTRKGLQSLLSWEPCKREPDPDTTMKGFLEKLFPSRGLDARLVNEIHIEPCGPWQLALAPSGPARAIWYQPEAKILVSWVFEPSARDQMRAILKSCTPNEGDPREYRIHGIHARVPQGYEIEAMHVHAANVMIHFESPRKRRLIYRRWGMPELVLDGRSLEDFFPWMLRATGVVVQEVRKETLEEMPAVWASFSMKPTFQLDKFMGRRWKNGEAWLWLNSSENRIYTFEQIGPKKLDPLDIFEANPGLRNG